MKNQKKYTAGFKGLLLILFISGSLVNTTHAAVKNVTGQLKLLATVDNRPAFSSVIWKISTSTGGVQKIVKTVNQHAATIALEPGTYQIVLTVKNREQIHKVTIVERKQYDLTINLD